VFHPPAIRSTEHAGLGRLGLVTEEDACKVDVALRRAEVGVSGAGLQSSGPDACSSCVRDRGVSTIVERPDLAFDLRLGERRPERLGVPLVV
jgi:hypothetical protein